MHALPSNLGVHPILIHGSGMAVEGLCRDDLWSLRMSGLGHLPGFWFAVREKFGKIGRI